MLRLTGGRIDVESVRSDDGNSLKLSIDSNGKCIAPSYKISFRKTNGESVERLVNTTDPHVTNLTCTPCSMSVSIPGADNHNVQQSEQTDVWFGPSKYSIRYY